MDAIAIRGFELGRRRRTGERGSHPLDLADYDAARPWAIPFDPGARTFLDVVSSERSRDPRWLLTLPGLRLVATVWRRRLHDPATWIAVEGQLGADRDAALALALEYATAQTQRQAVLDTAPPPTQDPSFRPRVLDPDDGPTVVRAFEALLVRHAERFACDWAETGEECPDSRGWAGVVETLPGHVRQWSVVSAELRALAAELVIPVRPMVAALRRERRLVVRVRGQRLAHLTGVRTPRGRLRCYRYRDCPIGRSRPGR